MFDVAAVIKFLAEQLPGMGIGFGVAVFVPAVLRKIKAAFVKSATVIKTDIAKEVVKIEADVAAEVKKV